MSGGAVVVDRVTATVAGLRPPGTGVSLFAVEDSSVQVMADALAQGPVRLSAGDAEVVVDHPGGPGAWVLAGLPADTDLDVVVESEGAPPQHLAARTLAPPPGPELFRLATVNDIHLGDPRFGHLPTVAHPGDGGEPPPQRCLRAAVSEAAAWGAELLLAKGDITDHGSPDEWATAAEVLSGPGLPVEAILGNHDVCRGASDGRAILAAAGIELHAPRPHARDLPGVRLVTADTTVAERNRGTIAASTTEVARLVADADGPALVAIHHHPQRHRLMTHPPRGIPGAEAMAFLDAVAAANPATLVITGHSHRHRRHRWGPITVAEVGSPQDYPGTWAGYVVHEGGIRQVVRRVAEPRAIAWTESTKTCFLGLWGRWGPGSVDQRCFSLRWPSR
ncbi:MAG: metallophosphoesterase family protein [Actinobacteria bacterium]|nr:metallophosphoesterase family protein [Actinomycetota bacterium]